MTAKRKKAYAALARERANMANQLPRMPRRPARGLRNPVMNSRRFMPKPIMMVRPPEGPQNVFDFVIEIAGCRPRASVRRGMKLFGRVGIARLCSLAIAIDGFVEAILSVTRQAIRQHGRLHAPIMHRARLMIPVTRETLASVPPKREPRHLGGSKRRGPGALGPGGHSQSKGPLIITSVAFGRSIEHERIICEVLGKHLVRAGHHFEWIKRCRLGDTGLAGGDRWPSCGASHDERGGADCEQCLGHLSSPCPVPNLCR